MSIIQKILPPARKKVCSFSFIFPPSWGSSGTFQLGWGCRQVPPSHRYGGQASG